MSDERTMYHFVIQLGGLNIGVNTMYPDAEIFVHDYLSQTEKTDFEVTVTKSDIRLEEEKARTMCQREGTVYPDFPDGTLEITAVYRLIAERLPDFEGCVFHGCVVGYEGKAYLFTADSGTGKTTHANLWLKHFPSAFILNGDKPILRKSENGIAVYGTPWAGKEGIAENKCLPLSAVCFLKRGQKNEIAPIKLIQCYSALLCQCYRPETKEGTEKTMAFLKEFGKIGLYVLHCNMDEEAAQVAYDGMNHN